MTQLRIGGPVVWIASYSKPVFREISADSPLESCIETQSGVIEEVVDENYLLVSGGIVRIFGHGIPPTNPTANETGLA